ncbi:NYN domain-containing protein [Salix suchowensis]|nr:NYN domain-containing protein [Salix suchowensis]
MYGIIKIFKAYVECSEQLRAQILRSELQSSGVSLTDCPHMGKKDVADKMMIDYAYAAALLRMRRFQVVVISTSGSGASNGLAAQASACYDWTTDVLGNASVPDGPLNNASARSSKEGELWRAASPLMGKLPTPSPEPVRTALPKGTRPRSSTLSRSDSIDGTFVPSTQPVHLRASSSSDSYVANDPRQPPRSISPFPATSATGPAVTRFTDVPDEVVYNAPRTPPTFMRAVPVTPKLPSSFLPQQPPRQESTGASGISILSTPSVTYGVSGGGSPDVNGKGKQVEQTIAIQPVLEHTPTPAPVPAPAAATPAPVPSFPASTAPVTYTSTPKPAIPSPALASSSSTTAPPVVPRVLPEAFRTLVQVLNVQRQRGKLQQSRSVVACEVISADKNAYEKAGVNKFAQYINVAESKGIVMTGGFGADAWISVRPEWYNTVLDGKMYRCDSEVDAAGIESPTCAGSTLATSQRSLHSHIPSG